MKIRPDIFLTSDTHFGHKNITTKGWGERTPSFNEDIIRAWNSVVKPKDVVLHLGDLTMANKMETLEWTKQLNGKKFLVLGNHDDHSESWYEEVGFTVIPDAHESMVDKYGNWTNYLFTHEPVSNLPVGWYNIHGHLHGNSHRGILPDKAKYLDVGVDSLGFVPKRLYEIINLLNKKNG